MIKQYLIGIAVVLIAIFSLAIIEDTITGNLIREEKDEKVVIYFPNTADFPNSNEGTIVFEFSFPAASFKVGNKSADLLMFLNSDVISGLKIGYDTKEKKIYAGLPLMKSEPIDLIDGKGHKLAYMFHNGVKKQSLYLDNQLLFEGDFTGEKGENILTGYSVYQKWTYVESPFGMKVSFGDEPEELKNEGCGCGK